MTTLAPLSRIPGVCRLVGAVPDDSWQTTPCLFILSTGRTGSSTLVRLLDLSPEVAAFHEPKPALLRSYRGAYAEAHRNPSRYRRLLARARRRLIGEAGRDGLVYAEATLLKFFAPVMAEMLPNARFLHLHRHPAEVVRSGMRRGWFRGSALDRYRIVPLADDPASRHWGRWDAFRKVCWTWHTENDYFIRLDRTIGRHRVLRLAFDQWTRPGTGAYRSLFDFLEVEPPRPEAVADVLAVKHNEQTGGEFPPYAEWPGAWRRILAEVAGPTMTRLGYA
jgi:hypothetical protein